MLGRILTSGLIAGAVAGFCAAVLQLLFIQPVLLHAELYEGGELVHFGAASSPADPPEFGLDPVRDGLSVIFSMLTYAGYALILVALMALAEGRGAVISLRNGMLWGVAGFVAVLLAPAFSLAPEVPGVAAADILPRQVWWFATVFSAGAAMWLLAFGQGWLAWGAAAVLLLAPHVIGAPEPGSFSGPAPTELGALFAARVLGAGLVSWALLGLFSAALWSSDDERAS
ncbi:MAG: cobalt transporter [Boseongicola sp. SB0676_bin_33]|nr:cobalt transporter [Boseongicola sp. SB0676_bin_33]MYK32505.1 cobalt transporter [Boseongicola sp. SB0670_bin_30]